MTTRPDADVERLEQIIEELRAVRTRRCEPKSRTNPRYLQLSNAVSNLLKVVADLRTEQDDDASSHTV